MQRILQVENKNQQIFRNFEICERRNCETIPESVRQLLLLTSLLIIFSYHIFSVIFFKLLQNFMLQIDFNNLKNYSKNYGIPKSHRNLHIAQKQFDEKSTFR